MPLANLVNPPTDLNQGLFDFSHQQDHSDIIAAIAAQHGANLAIRAIYPSFGQGADWKQLHQAMHNEMNSVLGLNGQNLQGEIDADWYGDNYLEHLAAHQVLGF